MTEKIVKRKPRKFIAEDFKIDTWSNLAPLYQYLHDAEINSVDELLQWMKHRSELDAIVDEDYAWRYIHKTRDTANADYEAQFNYFIQNIEPERMKMSNAINLKVVGSPFFKELDDTRFLVFKRNIQNSIYLFRTENIELYVQEEQTKNNYYKITGSMTVEHNGEELTLQQAGALLNSADRAERAAVYQKMVERRLEDKAALDDLFNALLAIRHQIALNAGFENFRDFKLKQLGRFDYGVKECEQFHDAIEHSLIPLIDELMEFRRKKLAVDVLRPYDLAVEIGSNSNELPFNGSEDLVRKTIDCLQKIDPYFGECIQIMQNMNHLDLESRKGKAPGGYNCPLAEIGVPFIFMNAANSPRDLKTMIHEGGHAVHSFLTADLEFNFEKRVTSEAAELASMSMEMFALDAYDTFYTDESERKAAIYNFLESNLVTVPWIALIDKFQHWLYTHPQHTEAERMEQWQALSKRFGSKMVDKQGFEEIAKYSWQHQLHIFMVPFYYIEYGIARLGSIALYRNFKQEPSKTIEAYKSALKMGYTEPLPHIYEKAGIPFNFDQAYIKELADFLHAELN
jgi:oligoendopeptidase F